MIRISYQKLAELSDRHNIGVDRVLELSSLSLHEFCSEDAVERISLATVGGDLRPDRLFAL